MRSIANVGKIVVLRGCRSAVQGRVLKVLVAAAVATQLGACAPRAEHRVNAPSAEYHVKRLRSAELGLERIFDIFELRRFKMDPGVEDALIEALDAPEPAVRFYAAEALASCGLSAEHEERALLKLVGLLDDRSEGSWCIHTKDGRYLDGFEPTVRIRALMTLAVLNGEDFGFDQEAWLRWLAGAEGAASQPHDESAKGVGAVD